MFKKVIALMCLGSTASATIVKTDIRDAINNHLVNADYSCQGYVIGASIVGEFENLSRDTIMVDCPTGLFLDCLDPTCTNVYLTSGATLLIPKRGKVKSKFMCLAESRLKVPTLASGFVVAPPSHSGAPKLCQIIDSLSLNCFTGQSALFALMENTEVASVIGAFVPKVNAVRQYVAIENKKRFFDFGDDYELSINPLFRPTKVNTAVALGTNGSYFVENYKDGDKVTLEVFDDRGKKLREIGFEKLYYGSKGLMMNKLQFSTNEADATFFVRVMKNNQLEREWLVQTS
jgi:hypothetical protein